MTDNKKPRFKLIRSCSKCDACGEGEMWGVLDTRDGGCEGTEFCEEADAEELCNLLNCVYEEGYEDGKSAAEEKK